MDNKTRGWSLKKHLLLTAFVLLAAKLIGNRISPKEASSIGIIGGVDGPTVMVISGRIPILWYAAAGAILLAMYKPVKLLIDMFIVKE